MRIDVRADRDEFEDEILKVFDGSYRYSNSVNPFEYKENIFCTIDTEQYPNIYKLKKIKKYNQTELFRVGTGVIRDQPTVPDLRAWSDSYQNKKWAYHITLKRFVYDNPRPAGNLDPIKLRKSKVPKDYQGTYHEKRVWRRDVKAVMDGFRKFLRFKGIEKHPRDFVWLASLESSIYDDDLHFHILLQDLGLSDFEPFKELVKQFNISMLSSSLSNKLKGFKMWIADPIRKNAVEIANRVNYVLKDPKDPSYQRKFVYQSHHLSEFQKDTTMDVIKPLL